MVPCPTLGLSAQRSSCARQGEHAETYRELLAGLQVRYFKVQQEISNMFGEEGELREASAVARLGVRLLTCPESLRDPLCPPSRLELSILKYILAAV